MKEIYFDNNATTMIAPEVLEVLLSCYQNVYGNPSSLHQKGVIAERALKAARKTFAELLKIQPHEFIFTASGTESNNLAIKGTARALQRKGRHIITSMLEHDAVRNSCKQLQQEGFDVTYLKPDKNGIISVESACAAVRKDTILAAFMHVNNELGSINPIANIAKALKDLHPKIVIFSDGVQAFGKISATLSHVDLYSVSAHKIHGPKGVAGLYIKQKTALYPLISGGGQEIGLRSGTENIPGIVVFAKAAELAYQKLDSARAHFQCLKNGFLQGLKNFSNAIVHSPAAALENTVNVSFLGIPAQVMMHSLEQKGIYVSAGSACSGTKRELSHVLRALELPKNQIESALRFSFSRYNTIAEVETCMAVISNVLEELRFIH